MFSSFKKIIYLSLVEKGNRQKNVGFARFCGEEEICRIELQLKGLPLNEGKTCPVYLAAGEERLPLLDIVVQAGKGDAKRELRIRNGYLEWRENRVLTEAVSGLVICLGPELFIEGYFPERIKEQTPPGRGKLSKTEKKEPAVEESVQKTGGKESKIGQEFQEKKEQTPQILLAEEFSDDKWEQLLKQYPKIHPFGDERIFISIEPKDFVILQASCQKLVNNSFLLHGFYNYHYLILGQDKALREEAGESFYVGVPGTYFEREKMVAVMFGFEGFECSGAVEVGKFGYYMRKVEL